MARQSLQGQQRRRQTQRLTLSLILWGLVPLAGQAQVIDLGAGSSDLRVQSGVLDFGKDIPARDTPRRDRAGGSEHSAAEGDLVLASYGTTRRSPKGSAAVEDLVLQVGADFSSDLPCAPHASGAAQMTKGVIFLDVAAITLGACVLIATVRTHGMRATVHLVRLCVFIMALFTFV